MSFTVINAAIRVEREVYRERIEKSLLGSRNRKMLISPRSETGPSNKSLRCVLDRSRSHGCRLNVPRKN